LRKALQEIAALDAPVSLLDVMPQERIETSNFGHNEVEVHFRAMTKVVIA
jgi:hypothetical protein